MLLQEATGKTVKKGSSFYIKPGTKVQALVTGDDLWDLGLEVYATDCYIHSLQDDTARRPKKRYLMKNSCIVDKRLTKQWKPRGQLLQYTGEEKSPYFFRCDLIVCRWDEECGYCN
uniref:Uncharacterized protein n=1 Tax=Clytia hemisphaerica TaxID=252671 RepID=A0A7M5X3B8_9CNID